LGRRLASEERIFSRTGTDVVVSGLVKVYGSGKTETVALRGLNMEVKAGEGLVVMGPSGCGKTTLLNIIGGLDKPTAGNVKVGEFVVNEAGERLLEKHRLTTIGFVFQTFNLIPMLTAEENVELPMILAGVSGEERRRRSRLLLENVGLGGKLYNKPNELSIGEQQRVAIAAALANDPLVVLGDEPTGELDSKNAAIVTDMLLELSGKYRKTVIIATHDPRVAVKARRILRIEDGVIAGEHTPLELQQPGSQDTLSTLIRLRLDSMEREYLTLEERVTKGLLKADEFNLRYSRLKNLENALRTLLAEIGG
jgi:putative ABC transport system ATP-binding protein